MSGRAKLDVGFPRHPKVVRLSLEARWAFIEGLCYAVEFETDGVIPETVAANGSARRELVEAGLWEIETASVVVHDFLVYNDAHSVLERKRHASRTVRASVNSSSDLGSEGFEEFWNLYPRKVGKPKARDAFENASRTVSTREIIEGTQRLAADPNLPELTYVPHPATWLNREGWNDDPYPRRGNRRPDAAAETLAMAQSLREQGR